MMNRILKSALRADFKSFVIKVFYAVSPGNQYLDNWHIDVICDAIMDMIENKNNRLIINIPPRYMKSIICSVALPAYLLGKDPKTNIICISYNDNLSEKFASDCRNIMQSEWYKELFPMTRLHKSRQSISDFETTAGGGRMATSIGGTLTGRGADWIIIDDPLKPSDSLSDAQRDKLNDWYGSTLYSRLNDKTNGKIILVMQRLHQDDLTGHLLESDAKFRLIKLPVIAQEDEKWIIKNKIFGTEKNILRIKGDLLHPARENMDTINDLKFSLGDFDFAGQYQQEPYPLEGGLVREEWFQYFDRAEIPWNLNTVANIFISLDSANKTGINNAYSAFCIVVMTRDYKFYLLDVVRGKWDFAELTEKTIEIYNTWKHQLGGGNCVKLLIEDMASGQQLIQILSKGRDQQGYGFNVEGIKPEGDKISRLRGTSLFIQQGRLLFPKYDEPWWADFKKELLGFPHTKCKDQVDALTQAITYPQTKPYY
ncbi:MAG: phage terminase large subunit [Alphaproteobacteria bacterium]|nr:phage terminase large subunit [Alphaproteobacteria bacterium]